MNNFGLKLTLLLTVWWMFYTVWNILREFSAKPKDKNYEDFEM